MTGEGSDALLPDRDGHVDGVRVVAKHLDRYVPIRLEPDARRGCLQLVGVEGRPARPPGRRGTRRVVRVTRTQDHGGGAVPQDQPVTAVRKSVRVDEVRGTEVRERRVQVERVPPLGERQSGRRTDVVNVFRRDRVRQRRAELPVLIAQFGDRFLPDLEFRVRGIQFLLEFIDLLIAGRDGPIPIHDSVQQRDHHRREADDRGGERDERGSPSHQRSAVLAAFHDQTLAVDSRRTTTVIDDPKHAERRRPGFLERNRAILNCARGGT